MEQNAEVYTQVNPDAPELVDTTGSRCLVLAHKLSGHTGTYTRLMLEALLEINWAPILLTSMLHLQTEEFRNAISDIRHDIEVFDVMPSFEGLSGRQNKRRQSHFLLQYIKELNPSHVLIPTFDGLAVPLAFQRRVHRRRSLPPTTGVVHNLSFGYEDCGISKRIRTAIDGFAIRRSGLKTLFFVDDIAYESASKTIETPKCIHLPDPVAAAGPIPHCTARERLGLPSDRFYVGVIGYLNRRKGVDLVLKGFASSVESLPKQATLLLAGKPSDEIRKLLRSYQGLIETNKIIIVDELLEYNQLPLYLQACDVVATIYPGHHGIASFLLRAVLAGRPVIGLADGWVGQMIERYGLGWTIDHADSRSVALGLTKSISESDFKLDRCEELHKRHHPVYFKRAIQSAVAAKKGLKS